MSLLAELKRRNVFRVALFYLVTSWRIVQAAETLLPIFDVPDEVLRGIVLILVLGFAPVLIFSWAFELTPDGLKRDREVRENPEIRLKDGRRLNWATLIAAALAIAVVAVDRMIPEMARAEGSGAAPPIAAGEAAATPQREPEPVAGNASLIAVLAFENRSPDPDNAFFAEGTSEEVLNALVRVEGLRVASRTSAFSFSGSDTPIPEIADALDVALRDLESAAARDPNFAEAWAFLAATQYLLSLGTYGTKMEPGEMARRARESVDRALREHPEFFELMDARGVVDYWGVHGFPLDCRLARDNGTPRLECGEQP